MATFTVTSVQDVVDPDDGVLSLREAIARANATATADAIGFAAAVEGERLVLTGGELAIGGRLRIDGDRDGDGVGVTLDGGNASRLVNIAGRAHVALEDLVLTNGNQGLGENGGAVLLGAGADLGLTRCTVSDSGYDGFYGSGDNGGGIFAAASSRLTVVDSSIIGNDAPYGGGIAAAGDVALTIRGSRVADNFGYYGGGAVRLRGGDNSLVLEDSVLSGNFVGNESYRPGGALDVVDATVTIARSSITGNSTFGGTAAASTPRPAV